MPSTQSIAEALARTGDLPERLAALLSPEATAAAAGGGSLSGPRTLAGSPRGGPAARSAGPGVERRSSGRWLAPELSYGRHFGPAPLHAPRAAVVGVLYRHRNQWYLPLTVRPPTLARHGGQISLPGGRLEAGESSAQAALRELEEELGIGTAVHLVGPLTERYVYVSNYRVTPWIAAAAARPAFQPDPGEVERVLEVPLGQLLDPARVDRTRLQRGPIVFAAPGYRLGDDFVWGATSVILWELACLLRQAAGPRGVSRGQARRPGQ